MEPETISFARGAPSPDLLPAKAVREAADRALASDWRQALSYGTGVGHQGLRAWLAERHGVEPERVMVTNGSLQAAVLLFQHLVSPGDRVVVEEPSYDRTLLILRRLGARLEPVALEADGIDTEALAERLSDGPAVRLAHVIPNHHNPAGCTLSEPKRRRLVQLAAEHELLLFEDDPYVDVGFEGDPLPTMLSMAPRHVAYACSFSKTIAPGVRVGYLVGPAELISTLSESAAQQYISPNMLAESIVLELCTSEALEQNLETVRTALRERRDTLCEALREHIPDADFVVPEGGYFLWLTIPEVDAGALQEAAAGEGVLVIRGSDFQESGGESSLRLSFASVPPADIPTGVERLARALERLRTPA